MRLILASESFIRKNAMDMLGLDYEVIPSHFDEKTILENDQQRRALKLAEAKANYIAQKHQDAIVIGSDAFSVGHDGTIFEKPESLKEAKRMILDLSGTTFQFISALAVCHAEKNIMLSGVDVCSATFRDISEEEVDRYVATHPVLKCSGAFDVAGALSFSKTMEGVPTFTTGMSIYRLMESLQQLNYFK